ncbi:MAG: hypothetical protein HY885_07370 [Deltaproteobacteria bacterium]|nr:hypothetical protein [Deltaproteobacteria bacterium]
MINNHIFRLAILMTATAFALPATVCLASNGNPARQEAAGVTILDLSKSIYVSSATASRQNNTLVVQGTVKPHSAGQGRIRGHVDISVIGPDGKLLAEESVLPRSGATHSNARSSRFIAYLELVPPPGSIVEITAHKGLH